MINSCKEVITLKLAKLLTLCTLSVFLIGCSKYMIKDKNNDINTYIQETNNEDTLLNSTSMKNIIEDKNKIEMPDNSKNVSDSKLRNSKFVEKYIEGIKIIKLFSENNSLNLKYTEPIEDRISRFKDRHDAALLNDLYSFGAETINYYTENIGLNIDLSISTDINEDTDIATYSYIIYKASIENIDSNFNFKDSKLNEFRNSLIEFNELDYDKIDKYIKGIISNEIKSYMVFFNKIDEDRYEVIRIENNNCYYKLVYDPKL